MGIKWTFLLMNKLRAHWPQHYLTDVENIARGWNGGPVFPLHIQTSGQEASNDFLLRVGGDVHTCPHQVHRLEGINW